MNNDCLLSICIPTYNRGKFLDESLLRIAKQFGDVGDVVEIVISDNCSPDNTPDIVHKYTDDGLPIRYIRNSENIGPDRNFAQCFRSARGKYLWLLGDDDYLKDGALVKIVDVLKTGTYGLVHLQMGSTKKKFQTQYNNSEEFLSAVHFWITFISANIVNTSSVPGIEFERYIGSYFIQIPLYLTSALAIQSNVVIHEQIIENGIDIDNTGGFNVFDVFARSYLSIWKEFAAQGKISQTFYEKQKYYMYKYSLVSCIYRYLIFKNRNYDATGGWKILFSAYGRYPYAYWYFLIHPLRVVMKKLRGRTYYGQ